MRALIAAMAAGVVLTTAAATYYENWRATVESFLVPKMKHAVHEKCRNAMDLRFEAGDVENPCVAIYGRR